MKLSQVPTFRTEDFPSQQTWISKFFVLLNPMIQQLQQIFDNNISFTDNIKSVTKTYDINTFQSFGVLWPYSDVDPQSVEVLQAKKGTQLNSTILIPVWSFDKTSSVITIIRMCEITDTPALAALSGRYQFTLRASV